MSVALLVACSAMTSSISTDDRAVLEAVFRDPWFSDAYGMGMRPVLLNRTELSDQHLWRLNVSTAEDRTFVNPATGATVVVDQEAIDSLLRRNRTQVYLSDLNLTRPLVFARSQGKRFRPTRIVTVSLPGYSRSGTSAVVAVMRAYDAPCCPDGYTALLVKRDGKWIVEAVGGFWVT